MFSLFNNPYPPPDARFGRTLLVSTFIGVFVAFFLIVFKPFDTSASSLPNLNQFLAGYGVVITVATLLPWILLRAIAPATMEEDNWTIGSQIVYLFCIVSIGITASYFYLLRAGGQANWGDYFYFFRNALLVAGFPLVILTLLDYIRKLRYYESGAKDINYRRGPKTSSSATIADQTTNVTITASVPPQITLADDQNRPELTTSPDQLWCLHSDGNYVEVWTATDAGKYERTLIRNTLSALSTQLSSHPQFINCHRSWVVNTDLVATVSGNAQGYRLHRDNAPTVIVARGRSKVVLGRLEERVSESR